MTPILITSLAILFCFALGLLFTVFIKNYLVRRALLDHPNERSSHTTPVPRGGGWALMAILIPGMILSATLRRDLAGHAPLIIGAIVLVVISWMDDRRGVSPLMRLSLHLTAACLGSLMFSPQELLFNGALPFGLDRAIMILVWAWFINLYNFMDGIDGITCVETICIVTGVCLVVPALGNANPFVDDLSLMLTGACLGFLALNWHPAKIFLGDVGSVPLGFLVGYILLALAVNGHEVIALILPLYYLADSGITLAKRILRGEKFWQAHRQHFYQRAALGIGRHDKVIYWVLAANIGLIGAALLATRHPLAGFALALALVVILLRKMHKAADTFTAP